MRKYILSSDQYYEAILQIRPKSEEVLKYALKQIEKRKNAYVSIRIDWKNGYDLYVSDQKFTRALGKQLKKVFTGEVKLSRKLYGFNRQSGKKVYRVTVLFRLKQ